MLARRVDVDEIVRQTRPADQLRRAAIGDQCSCAAVPSREMQSGAGHARRRSPAAIKVSRVRAERPATRRPRSGVSLPHHIRAFLRQR